MPEEDRQKKLREDRKKDNFGKNARELAQAAKNPASAAKTALSITTQFRVNDLLFAIPMLFAMLKDLSDIFFVGSLWGVGTVISICCSIMGGLFIWLLGAGEIKKQIKVTFNGSTGRLLILIAGTTIEAFIMGVNFFPVETFTFIIIYLMLLFERAQNAESGQSLPEEATQHA